MPPTTTSSSDPSAPAPTSWRTGALSGALVLAALCAGRWVPTEPMTRNVSGPRIPYRTTVFYPDPAHVADTAPRVRHAHNGQGLRGSILTGPSVPGLEVLMVSSSAAECELLDERDALGARLQARLGGDARVATLGQAGLPADAMIDELEAQFAIGRRPGIVVGLFGAPGARLATNRLPWLAPAPGAPWSVHIPPDGPFGVRGRVATYRGWYVPGSGGAFLEPSRRAYADASQWQRSLHPAHRPRVESFLRAYAATLDRLQRMCQAHGAQLVLATQPVAPWAPPANGRGWAPFIHTPEGEGIVPSPDLTRMLVHAHNRVTRACARRHRLPLADLEHHQDGDAESFYDQWHFTRAGADRASQHIADAIRSRR